MQGQPEIENLLQIFNRHQGTGLDLEYVLYHVALVLKVYLPLGQRPLILKNSLRAPPNPVASVALISCIEVLSDFSASLQIPENASDLHTWREIDPFCASIFLSLKYAELCYYVLQEADDCAARFKPQVLKTSERRADQLIRLSLEKFTEDGFAAHFGSFFGEMRVWQRWSFRCGLLRADSNPPPFEFTFSLKQASMCCSDCVPAM